MEKNSHFYDCYSDLSSELSPIEKQVPRKPERASFNKDYIFTMHISLKDYWLFKVKITSRHNVAYSNIEENYMKMSTESGWKNMEFDSLRFYIVQVLAKSVQTAEIIFCMHPSRHSATNKDLFILEFLYIFISEVLPEETIMIWIHCPCECPSLIFQQSYELFPQLHKRSRV